MKKKSVKKTIMKRKSSSKKRPLKTVEPSDLRDKLLRDHVLDLLRGGGAHTSFDAAMGDWPVQLAGVKVANFPHTAWMLLEHMRLGQWDILEFSRKSKHISPKWPEGYWPASEAPANEKAWNASMVAFKKDLKTMQGLVAGRKIDLYARIPWGDGQTILREALVLADHNSYHLGQLAMLRKSIGI
jgi:hypothetical protein